MDSTHATLEYAGAALPVYENAEGIETQSDMTMQATKVPNGGKRKYTDDDDLRRSKKPRNHGPNTQSAHDSPSSQEYVTGQSYASNDAASPREPMSNTNSADAGDNKGSNEAVSAKALSYRLYCVKPGDEPEPLENPVSRLIAVDDSDVPKIALVMDETLCEAFYTTLGAWNDAQIDARKHQAKSSRLRTFMRYAQKGIWAMEAKCAEIEQDYTRQRELSLLVRRCNEYKLMLSDAEDEADFLDQQLVDSERSVKEWLDHTFVMIQEFYIAKGTMQPDLEDIMIEPAFLSRWSVPEGVDFLRDVPVVEAKAENELKCAKIELQAAQRDFDNRKAIPYEYYADPQQQVDYDLHRLQQNMNLSQDLVQAEKRVADAKAERRRQCHKVTASDESSALQDCEQDGRYLSGVCESLQGPDNQTTVCQWLQSLPDVLLVEEPEPPEVDQWDSRSVCIEDSRSMVDEGCGRERIDAYNKASEELRSAALEDVKRRMA